MLAIEVVYENGVFRPLTPVSLPEGALGEVLLPQLPLKPQQDQDDEELAATRSYRFLMEIAGAAQPSPDAQTDVALRHDEFLYPKQGDMP